jgi:hypothetical protein
MADHLRDLSLNDLAISGHIHAPLEFTRRQTVALQNTARYLLWSVIAIAITSGVNALFAFLTWSAPNSH